MAAMSFMDAFNQKLLPLLDPAETAFLAIDVEEKYFDPAKNSATKVSKKVAQKIASFLPMIRKSGVPVFAVYYSSTSFDVSEARFYKLQLMPEDTIVRKETLSAFGKSHVYKNNEEIDDLAGALEKRGIKNIIICGGYLSGCVKKTVMDALASKKYNVILAENLSTDGGFSAYFETCMKQTLSDEGAIVANAGNIYRSIKPPL